MRVLRSYIILVGCTVMAQTNEGVHYTIDCLDLAVCKRICDYLHVRDLVTACLTVPGWHVMLEFPGMKVRQLEYVENIVWIDQKLLELCQSADDLDRCSDLPLAIQHHGVEESKVVEAGPQVDGLPHNPFLADCQLFTSQDTSAYVGIAYELMFLQMENKFQIYASSKAKLAAIFVFFGHAVNFNFTEEKIRTLRGKETLLILHVTDPSKDSVSNAPWIRHTMQLCGDFPSRIPCKNWRIWHIEKRGSEFVNLSAAMHWVRGKHPTPPNPVQISSIPPNEN